MIHRRLLSPSSGGFVTFDLAQGTQAPHLALGEQYTWRLSLLRDAADRASDLVIEMPMQRVAADAQPESSGAFARAEVLLSQGLIQDAIAELTRLQKSDSASIGAQAAAYLQQLLPTPSDSTLAQR